MAKAKKESSVKKTPYTRKPKNKKPITKSEKIKNADLTGQLDNLMDDLTQHFQKKKKKPLTNESLMEDSSKLEQEQARYEKTQNDMEDALGLLVKL